MGLVVFFVKTRGLVKWKFVSLLVSYCYYISEGKDVSAVFQGCEVKRPCDRCAVTKEDFISGEMAGVRSVRETKLIMSRFL